MKADTDTSKLDLIFGAFLEEFHEGRGSLEDLCREHPQYAERFRAMFSMLAELDEVTPSDSAPKSKKPRVLEGLELVREIGRGGMGVVWEARDTKLDRRVAVKLLPERSSLWNEARARFQREVVALGRLSHPHIVTVHRADLEDRRPYLVMEYVPGASLQEILRALEDPGRPTRPTPSAFRRAVHALHDAAQHGTGETTQAAESNETTWFECAARLVAETAEALDYAHHHGIVHRDVKPGNILVDLWGRARLVDFGISKVKDEATLTVTGGFTGTAAYAAPEQ
ncbi:MAG: serine/threonine protein kinase, partial [Planctomycetes bacterium]|nr:serine/threonine protein kinase [Planctomycetota bacterium]